MDPFIPKMIEEAAIYYFQLYRLDTSLSLYHHLISLVTSQQVKFETGRQIRRQLYSHCYPLDPNIIVNLDLSRIRCLTTARIYIIKNITKAALNGNEDLLEVAKGIIGVGSWTIKGALILTERSPTEALHEDSYICKRLTEIYGFEIDKPMCRTFFMGVTETNLSITSYFLWRLKSSGCQALIAKDRELTKDDFL